MAERPIRPKMRAREDAPTKANEPSRETRRYILPTLRVAEFLVPNVGEFLKIRDHAVIKCHSINGNEDPSTFELGAVIAELSLRRLLCGLSQKPVPVMYRPGAWDEAKAREAATEAVLEAHRERMVAHAAALAERQPSPGAPWDDDEIAQRIDHAVEQASFNAEDPDAMKASANVARVTDLDWDSDSGSIGRLRNAALGSEEAVEWIALQEIASDFFRRLTMAAQNAPRFGKGKAEARSSIRSWR